MTDTRARFTRCLFVSLCVCAAAQAAEPVVLEASRDYLVGASLVSSAAHVGQTEQRLSLRPLWAFQLGRFRFATGRASSLLSVGRDTVDPGLSTSLQYDKGRESGADPLLVGLPDVRDTLRGRASASLALGPRWSGSVSGSQDLLGRDGGFYLNTGLNYRYPVSEQTYWDLGLGAVWGTDTYRQTHYGISPAAALATGRTAYALGAGWERVSLGVSMTTALNRRWVAFGGLSLSQLQGATARSPLVGRKTVYGATLGLAYRNN
jgi:outer membrane scaffolding protein for murein synthesis (MipA/OmpV family)